MDVSETTKPVRRLSYELGPADWLAYEFQTTTLTWSMKAVMTVIIGIAGLAVGALPDTLGSALWWLATIFLLLVGAISALMFPTWAIRRRAAAWPQQTGKVVLEEQNDVVTEQGPAGTRSLDRADLIGVVQGTEHLFIRTANRPVIVPASAFADREKMIEYGRHLDGIVKQARLQRATLQAA